MSGGDEMGAEGRTESATATAEIRKIGYLRKLKTMKKKFFVLKTESGVQPACLEYYDNEKKWKAGGQPKRTIVLKTCFNINRKLDTKQKHALALYTKDDCFTVVLDSAEELDEWLGMLLALQHGDETLAAHQPPKPTFEHVWQVNIRNRGLASSKNILGPYHLCLTSHILSLVKLNTEEHQVIEFPLMSIRRCGHSYCFFFMELGRSAVTGSGELWMQTEDVIIAQNMHETILNAMRTSTKEDLAPRQRVRSSSTNEASKPISVRRQATVVPPVGIVSTPAKRERSDSVPTRSRTLSDNQHDVCGRGNQPSSLEIQRPHSMYAHGSCSPPGGTFSPSPCSAPGTIDSAGSSLSIEDPFDLSSQLIHLSTSDNSYQCQTSITEEGGSFEDYLPMTPPDSKLEECCRSSSPAHLYRSLSSKRASTSSVSPSILGSSKKSTSPSQQPDYLEMTSSIANSPAGSEGYMTMNLLGNSLPDVSVPKAGTPDKLYLAMSPTSSISADSRKTSTDENANGYVAMAPLSLQSKTPEEQGYMDMTPTKQGSGKLIGDDAHLECPSTQPITSGTPSTDVRFSEFQLEKVRTYFSACEDERLVRAYSVGSKPKPAQSLSVDESSSRVRAFSVGSKVEMKFDKQVGAEVGASKGSAECNESGKKCSSAPLLSSSWSSGQSTLLKLGGQGNHTEDLMEMDFAKSNDHGRATTDMQQQNKSGLRPRTSSRSSSGRPSKLEWLQVIGEGSLPATSTEPSAVQRSTVLNDYVEGSCKPLGKTHVGAEVGQTDQLMDTSTKNGTLSLAVASSVEGDRRKRSESPSLGEYVNIDLNKHTPTSERTPDVSTSSFPCHEYMNIQVGRLASTRKVASQVKEDAPATSLESTTAISASKFAPLSSSNEALPKANCSRPSTSKSTIQRNRHSSCDNPYQNISFGNPPLRSRPASVSSDRELNYASLDLMAAAAAAASASSSLEEEVPRSPGSIKSSSSTNGNRVVTGDGENTKLDYARIDFTKFEGLRATTRDNVPGKKEK